MLLCVNQEILWTYTQYLETLWTYTQRILSLWIYTQSRQIIHKDFIDLISN